SRSPHQTSSRYKNIECKRSAGWHSPFAEQLTNRVAFRRAMRKAIQGAMRQPQQVAPSNILEVQEH
ncbi:hypothetical protein ACNQT2_11660, partial [Corynebacterium diphtheriae]